MLPLQHPLGQELASHTHCPPLHSWPVAHALQLAPPLPHEPFDSPVSGSQVDPLQHPRQVPPPQLHTPLTQLSPLPHELHAAPPVPHWLEDCVA